MDRAPETEGCFSIGELAKAARISTRTLRDYESIGLLTPARSENGYRAYSFADAKQLAQIQAMKQCGLPLNTIRRVMSAPRADVLAVLRDHLETLRAQEGSLNLAISRTLTALETIERIEPMDVKDAFEALKEQGLADFEKTYGQEARERYGDATIDEANARMMALTKDEWDAKELLEEAIKVQLRIAMATHDPKSEEAQELARMHEKWISIHWGSGYAREAYLGLVQGYLADPRFVEYYDSAAGEGATEFLIQAVRS